MKDLPDYTRQVTIRYEGGFIGLEELATRLGFIGPFNLQGNIVLMESFESELTDWVDESGTGYATARSSRHKYSGDWSGKLYSTTGIYPDAAYLYRLFPFPGLLKYALFARFYRATGSGELGIAASFDNRITLYSVLVEYLEATNTLRVLTTSGGYHTVGSGAAFALPSATWLSILVTFDLESGYYDKLYVADREYDISDVPLCSAATLGYYLGKIEVSAYTVSETALVTYIDDIIVTKNVP